MSEQAGRYQRSFSGLVGAMVILLVVVVAFVGFRALFRDNEGDPVQAVDYSQGMQQRQSVATFHLLAPATLPAGWEATSVRFSPEVPQAWHLGVLTEAGHYIGLEQAQASAASLVHEYVDSDATEGSARDGWRTFSDAGGDHALAREDGGVATLIMGMVPVDQLLSYASSLQ